MTDNGLMALLAGRQTGEAVRVALGFRTQWVQHHLQREGALPDAVVTEFLRYWLAALPPYERLQAVEELELQALRRGVLASALQAFATELRSFWAFTDGPDAEMDESMVGRLTSYAARLDELAAGLSQPPPEPGAVMLDWPDAASFSEERLERLRRGLDGANELMQLLAADRLDQAVELALLHRPEWVELRLGYDAVQEHDQDVSAFLQEWLPRLPPLERLEAASWASSNYLTALVYLDHAYGIGARLVLEASEAVAKELAASVRRESDHAERSGARQLGRRLRPYAEQLDAMSFDPVPLREDEPEVDAP